MICPLMMQNKSLMENNMNTHSLSWGIIGTGTIAQKFASELPHSRLGRLRAVGSRRLETARQFSEKFDGIRAHGSYEDLLADPHIEAVYISTPHQEHARWAILAAEAGKHVLCEKPAALNHADAMVAIEAARRNGVLFMEAFMYRCHPRTKRLAELIAGGIIGRVHFIQATFSCRCEYNPSSRLFDPEYGGGGILDLGCYTTSVTRLIAGAAAGKSLAEPITVEGVAIPRPTGVDAMGCALMKFPDDLLAQVTCGNACQQHNDLRVSGETGTLFVREFWNPPGPMQIFNLDGSLRETIETDANPYKYALQADAFAVAIEDPSKAPVTIEDTLGNMRVLDHWRESAKITFPPESVSHASRQRPLSGRALQHGRFPEIPSFKVPGLEKPVSRLAMGMDSQSSFSQIAALADDFFERGGNVFDTAPSYGLEELWGQWLENRGVQDQAVVIVKGTPAPSGDPENLEKQLKASLERLKIHRADFYLLRRDNPEIPVGEFVDVLDAMAREGRACLTGVSNWTLERILAANEYAVAHGKNPIAVVSGNFSLARMVEPIGNGCEAANTSEWRDWLHTSQCLLLASSSQAQGYLLDAPATGVSTQEILRRWDSEENRLRRERAYKLTAKKGVSATNIALAYILAQDFPVISRISPCSISELRDSASALQISLNQKEVA